jgi:DNA-binding transcriptional ArsR family regulator
MSAQEQFLSISSLICEPARARMLWNLLDGRAYTATELAMVADVSATSASNHLTKLLDADIVKVEIQGRHRYYAFSRPEVAYAVESLANLGNGVNTSQNKKQEEVKGIRFCRSCYDHVAGIVGVTITEALEEKGCLKKSSGREYIVTKKGWNWFLQIGISEDDFVNNRRAIARQCLDWTERKPHMAGQLGAILLQKMFDKKWLRKTQFSRELVVTAKGQQELNALLGINIKNKIP